jgi:hypothetical protein
MSRVFVTQKPYTRMRDGAVRYIKDISPAKQYGELVYMANRGDIPEDELAAADLVWKLRALLSGFTRHDYLLPMGHPTVMMIAGCIAAEQTGGEVKILVWNKEAHNYDVFRLDLNAQP